NGNPRLRAPRPDMTDWPEPGRVIKGAGLKNSDLGNFRGSPHRRALHSPQNLPFFCRPSDEVTAYRRGSPRSSSSAPLGTTSEATTSEASQHPASLLLASPNLKPQHASVALK